MNKKEKLILRCLESSLRQSAYIMDVLDGENIDWINSLSSNSIEFLKALQTLNGLTGEGNPLRGFPTSPVKPKGKRGAGEKGSYQKVTNQIDRQFYIPVVKKFYQTQLANHIRKKLPTEKELEEDLYILDKMVRLDKLDLGTICFALDWATEVSDFWPAQLIRFAQLRGRSRGDGKQRNGPLKIETIIAQFEKGSRMKAKRAKKVAEADEVVLKIFRGYWLEKGGDIITIADVDALSLYSQDWAKYYEKIWPTKAALDTVTFEEYRKAMRNENGMEPMARRLEICKSKETFAIAYTRWLDTVMWPEMSVGVFKVDGNFFNRWIAQVKRDNRIGSMTRPPWEREQGERGSWRAD